MIDTRFYEDIFWSFDPLIVRGHVISPEYPRLIPFKQKPLELYFKPNEDITILTENPLLLSGKQLCVCALSQFHVYFD